MEKINIAELLKDCPKGMELDCTIFDNVTFERVTHGGIWINYINNRNYKYDVYLDNEGCLPVSSLNLKTTKCVIFPKGKTTWEGFHRPFKDGDILFYKHKSNNVKYTFIYKRRIDMHYLLQYCGWFSEKPYLSEQFNAKERMPLYENDDIRFATEEEKQKLFDAIEMNGYKWNAETKTLEKLPEFKDGDIIFAQYYDLKYIAIVKQIDKSSDIHVHCLYGFTDAVFAIDEILGSLKESLKIRFATEEEKQLLFDAIKDNGYRWNNETKTLEKLIKPKFKVGDIIKLKGGDEFGIITEVADCFYTIKNKNNTHCWPIKKQDDWELVPNKFDINTLKQFESRVLVRNVDGDLWKPAIYGFSYSKGCYVVGGIYWRQCIPYEKNEHLLGTTDDCEEYYKTWE